MPSGFRPDRYVEDNEAFGRKNDPGWKTAESYEQQQLALSQIQHRLALRLRKVLGGSVIDTLAEQTAQTPIYVQRKLNGQVPLTAQDLMAWTKVAGVDLPVLLADAYGETNSSSTG